MSAWEVTTRTPGWGITRPGRGLWRWNGRRWKICVCSTVAWEEGRQPSPLWPGSSGEGGKGLAGFPTEANAEAPLSEPVQKGCSPVRHQEGLPSCVSDDSLPRGEQNLLLHRQYQGEVSLGCSEANPIRYMRRTDIRTSFKSYLKTLD